MCIKPLPMFTAYRGMGFSIRKFPNAYRQYENEITLPLHTRLSNGDVEHTAECLSLINRDTFWRSVGGKI